MKEFVIYSFLIVGCAMGYFSTWKKATKCKTCCWWNQGNNC